MYFTIGEMAKFLNIPASTLRYYDREGMMPAIERSEGGIRMFKAQDYEWLCMIECLKRAGMPLRNIKKFVALVRQGDATITPRLEMIDAQRKEVERQISDLQEMLDVLDYKHWFYKTAQEHGTTDVPRNMSEDELPPQLIRARRYLKKLHPEKADAQ